MPDWRSEIERIIAPLGLSPARETSVVTELEQHLAEHYADLLAQGVPVASARSTVLGGLDNHELLREFRKLPKEGPPIHSAPTGGGFWDELSRDVRFAFRMLSKNPGFTAIAILTLAIGFGATTAVFSLVDRVMLRPLYPDMQRLLVLEDVPLSARKQKLNMTYKMSYPIYLSWKEQKDIFESVSAMAAQGPSLTGMGDPERLQAAFVSSDLLPTLGLMPMIGRGFRSEDEPSAAPPVVLLTSLQFRSRCDWAQANAQRPAVHDHRSSARERAVQLSDGRTFRHRRAAAGDSRKRCSGFQSPGRDRQVARGPECRQRSAGDSVASLCGK